LPKAALGIQKQPDEVESCPKNAALDGIAMYEVHVWNPGVAAKRAPASASESCSETQGASPRVE